MELFSIRIQRTFQLVSTHVAVFIRSCIFSNIRMSSSLLFVGMVMTGLFAVWMNKGDILFHCKKFFLK